MKSGIRPQNRRFVRRHSPELIIPDTGAAVAAGMTAAICQPNAAANTMGAWAEVCSTTEFGSSPLVLVGGFIGTRIGASLSAVGTVFISRQVVAEFGTGAAASEVAIDQQMVMGAGTFAQILGLVDDAATALAGATVQPFCPITPRYIPASTRLSARVKYRDAVAGNRVVTVFGVAINPATFTLVEIPFIDEASYWKGASLYRAMATDQVNVSSAASVQGYGAWVDMPIGGVAAADADYLFEEFVGGYDEAAGTTMGYKIFEIGILPIGGTPGTDEIPNMRAAAQGANPWEASSMVPYSFMPFLVKKGETVRVRVKDTLSTARDYFAYGRMLKMQV